MELLLEYVELYNPAQHLAAEEKKDLLFLDDGRHITELVNSYYFVGAGEDTVICVDLPEHEGLSDLLCKVSKEKAGDGTVSLYSATVGGTLPAERTFVKRSAGERSATHDGLVNGEDITNLDFVLAVLRGEADEMSKFDLKSRYNIEKGAPNFEGVIAEK